MSAVLSSTVFNITVTVYLDSSGNPALSCSPDPASITAPNAMLVFTLTGLSGYQFPSLNAVVVTSGGEQFPFSSWTTSATTAQVYDANTNDTSYKYTITAVNTTTGAPVTLDPYIKNNTTSAD